MGDIIYLRMKKNLELSSMQEVQLKDIAYISTTAVSKEKLESIPIYRITKKDKNIVIIDSFLILDHLNSIYKNIEIQLIGPTQTIIRIKKNNKKPAILLVSAVWVLLFVGAAMTIMNFHYDVSMQEVQQKLHYILTGKQNEFPLWIQIPYSIGLGMGMLLFFNHWFNKRINEEPSPLEVEIFNYQQDLDNYVNYYENELNDTKPPL
ncbi:stage V sporulation protein AA [Virgibacillus profundi]|uniref:Stage V sporulation protein AA n=1 Tax=Virgibacillus profundi TaxID=2024555 RepID=A0A2A2IDV5_9BACI|nr:stage V sporulation protein AA [Virgibacillus profundi]PAV29548.1 stage V sporulation protein AA [Virgibacillus profundi]PXY53718.1 stage V sporulation protein AA [Virgibacillus profundi]